MKIEFFTFDNDWGVDSKYLPEWRNKNYSTFQQAVDVCLINYKPSFNPRIKFCDAKIYRKEIVNKDIFSSRKNRKGVYPIISQTKEEISVLDKDYTKYCYSKEDLKKPSWQCNAEEKLGFLETKIEESVRTIENDSILWKAQVFVKFFDAHREFSREIKEAGKPYQPEREEVVVLGGASDWLPVWWIKGDNYNKEKFGLNNNIDSWFRASEYWVEHRIWIKKNELEIE